MSRNHIYRSASELVGSTPLMEMRNMEREEGLQAVVLAKLEYLNPAGSVKDRIAKNMLDTAEAAGSKLTLKMLTVKLTAVAKCLIRWI